MHDTKKCMMCGKVIDGKGYPFHHPIHGYQGMRCWECREAQNSGKTGSTCIITIDGPFCNFDGLGTAEVGELFHCDGWTPRR